jgi:hypothetical protein
MRIALRTLAVFAVLLTIGCFTRRYTPPEKLVLESGMSHRLPAYDVFGREIYADEARELMQTEDGRAMLAPANGAVRIDNELLELGESEFYGQTFGNEVFLTDVMGILDGPLTPNAMMGAVRKLKGKPTSNLRVPIGKEAQIGDRFYRKGEIVDTGLDVPAGAIAPMGMTAKIVGGKTRVGVSCSLCHSTVDSVSGKVVHGAPNADLNAGLLMAAASNSAA